MGAMRVLSAAVVVCAASLLACGGAPGNGDGGGGSGGSQDGGGANGGSGGAGGAGGSGASGGSGGGAPPAGSVGEFSIKVATAYCNWLKACGKLDDTELDVCLASNLRSTGYSFNTFVVDKVNAGTMTFVSSKSAACLAAIPTQPCKKGNVLPAECSGVVVASGMAGVPCEASSDCGATGYCPTGATTCRSCVALGSTGTTCTSATQCQAGLRCITNGGGMSACSAPRAAGGVCGSSLDCTDAGYCATFDGGTRTCTPYQGVDSPCSTSFLNPLTCAPGTLCLTFDGGSAWGGKAGQFCSAYRSSGQPCTSVTECGPTGLCPAQDGGPQTCVARAADGQPCTKASDCVSNKCSTTPKTLGGPSALCGYVSNNQPCVVTGTFFYSSDCAPGSLCSGARVVTSDGGMTAGVCKPYSVDGGACTLEQTSIYSNGSCANASEYCVGGTCSGATYAGGLNAPCRTTSQCQDGFTCKNNDPITGDGTCVARGVLDAACTASADCANGFYCTTTGRTCQPLSGNNQPCVGTSLACKSYTSCKGTGSSAVCVAYAGYGEACDPAGGASCAASFCDAGQCVGYLANGEPCTSSTYCLSNKCSNPDGGFTNRTCQPGCF